MNNAELRARARQNLGGSLFHTEWLTALAVCLVASLILSLGSSFTGVFSRNGRVSVFGLGGSVLSILLMGPITFGTSLIFLKKARGSGPIVFGDLFKGFERFGDTLVLSVMQRLIPFLWFLIPIAGIYFGLKKSYGFAMAMYVKVDYPDAPWRECLDRSVLLMDGFRWKLFCLQFSFLGWIIVGALCLGVGTLWVTPYLNAAVANFYEDRRLHGAAL